MKYKPKKSKVNKLNKEKVTRRKINPTNFLRDKWYYATRKVKPTQFHPYTTKRFIFKVIAAAGSNIIVYTQEPGTIIKSANKIMDSFHAEEVFLGDLSNAKGPFDTYNELMDAIYNDVYK